jgi:hypothetical protein
MSFSRFPTRFNVWMLSRRNATNGSVLRMFFAFWVCGRAAASLMSALAPASVDTQNRPTESLTQDIDCDRKVYPPAVNVLSEEKKQQVIALGRLGWSLQRIQSATRIRRETAAGYLRSAGIPVRRPGG